MKGNIYSREKCLICGGKLLHIEKRNGCFCEKHSEIAARKFFVQFPGGVYKNFSSYPEAAQFLSGLRYKSVEGSFDPQDYQKDKPLGFKTLSKKYLERKKDLKSFKEIKGYIRKAQLYFDQGNIKQITGAHLEDFLFSIPDISEKTRSNYKSALSGFWKWLYKRDILNLAEMPHFPEVPFELDYRKLTDWETQQTIIDEVKWITDPINPKIGFGIELLATYTALRPDDLRRINEEDFDSKNGVLIIRRPTKRKNHFKTIRLVPEHIEELQALRQKYPGLPELPLFRHLGNQKNGRAGQGFGPKYFRVWWNKACENLGIEGLDLYGGTRHTTTTEIARNVSSDAARKASGHETNKAFDRYCQIQDSTAFEMAKVTLNKRKKGAIIGLKKPNSQKNYK